MRLGRGNASLCACWRSRGRVPSAVEAKDALERAEEAERDGHLLASRLARATAIVRLVNASSDAQRGMDCRRTSVAARSARVGLPRTLVDARHEATHASLPSPVASREASTSALDWIEERYTRAQARAVEDKRNQTVQLARTAWTARSTRSFQLALAAWSDLVPPSWGHESAQAFLAVSGPEMGSEKADASIQDDHRSKARRGSSSRADPIGGSGSETQRPGGSESAWLEEEEGIQQARWRRVVESMSKRWPTSLQWMLMEELERMASKNRGKAKVLDAKRTRWIYRSCPLGPRRSESLLLRTLESRLRHSDVSESNEEGSKRDRKRFAKVLLEACGRARREFLDPVERSLLGCDGEGGPLDRKEASSCLDRMRLESLDANVNPWTRAMDWETCAIGTIPGDRPYPNFRVQDLGFRTDERIEDEPSTASELERNEGLTEQEQDWKGLDVSLISAL